MSTRVKICGCRTPRDIHAACLSGADAVGFIFAPSSARVEVEQAAELLREVPSSVTPVAVFANPLFSDVDAIRSLCPRIVIQLSGTERPDFCERIGGEILKVIAVDGNPSAANLQKRAAAYSAPVLFDTKRPGRFGGTGISFDWRLLRGISLDRPFSVAGGLQAENVGSCIRLLRPHGVDVRSGVETNGRKDEAKMRTFIRAVREADAS